MKIRCVVNDYWVYICHGNSIKDNWYLGEPIKLIGTRKPCVYVSDGGPLVHGIWLQNWTIVV